jgi:hypothetical protein
MRNLIAFVHYKWRQNYYNHQQQPLKLVFRDHRLHSQERQRRLLTRSSSHIRQMLPLLLVAAARSHTLEPSVREWLDALLQPISSVVSNSQSPKSQVFIPILLQFTYLGTNSYRWV